MVFCLERGADLHMAQRMPLPLTVSCFSKIQIGFTFLVPAHPGSPRQRAIKRVCVCVVQILDNFLQVILAYNSMLILLMQVESPLLCSIIDQADDDGLVPIPDQ